MVDDESGEIVGQLNLTRKEPVIDEVKKLGAGDGDGKENAPEGINEEIFREVMRFTNEVHTMKEVEHFGELGALLIASRLFEKWNELIDW